MSEDKWTWPYLAVRTEVEQARHKFPRPDLLLTALVEEVGELAQALLQHGSGELVEREAIQVAAVAIRILEEGDPIYHDLDAEARQR